MNFEFGEIYIAKFHPSTGKEFKKIRPAIVIQESTISKKSPYVTVMPISSQLHKLGPADILLAKDDLNGLKSDSVIQVRQISSFDKKRFVKKIGRAGSPATRRVRGYLRKHFGL